jgi:hypothetical protein
MPAHAPGHGAAGTAVVAALWVTACPFLAQRLPDVRRTGTKEFAMQIILLQPLVALTAGILILVFPRLLNYIVAIYLIVVGLVGLAEQIA